MSEPQHQFPNTQTFYADISDFEFETIEQAEGRATVIRFRLAAENIRTGDILAVLEGSEIRFHGIVFSLEEDGRACAADRHGSTLPGSVQ